MDINKIAKLMSDKNKSRIIAHFFTCKCNNFEVNGLCGKLHIEQSNMSKHLTSLNKIGVLGVKVEHKKRYYYMEDTFRKQWGQIIEPMIKHEELRSYQCKH